MQNFSSYTVIFSSQVVAIVVGFVVEYGHRGREFVSAHIWKWGDRERCSTNNSALIKGTVDKKCDVTIAESANELSPEVLTSADIEGLIGEYDEFHAAWVERVKRFCVVKTPREIEDKLI